MSTEPTTSVSSSPLDPRECLEGVRQAYFENDTNVDDNDDNNNDDDEEEVDPDTLQQISQVEEDLLALLKLDDSLDAEQVLHDAKHQPGHSELAKSLVPLAEISALHSKHAFPCSGTNRALPSNPSVWPQGPLMIRPTPNTSTKIRGIRRAKSLKYEDFSGLCAGCILPINCGTEAPGESLVVDFESTYFVGTMLLRIKQAKPLKHTKLNDDGSSYFDGKKRKFQAVVKGRFRTPLPMSETVTGQVFDRPSGKLPARWIVTSFIKFISTLAPQLEAKLDGQCPRFLTPLVATAHAVLQHPISPTSSNLSMEMENEVEEVPPEDPASLLSLAHDVLGTANPLSDTATSSTAARMKARKRAYNQLAVSHDTTLQFDTNKEYTFEFYQHLLDFGDDGLAIDMGRHIGKVGLSQATNGQPLKFMSAHKHPATEELDTLWSFDIWHASLYPYAEKALKQAETYT